MFAGRYYCNTVLIILQIAVKEALPLQEFAQNPFAVLCTTSIGGHLSWFESGGGRWFAKPVRHAELAKQMSLLIDGSKVARFLNLMARDIESVTFPQASEQAGSTVNTLSDDEGLLFEAMRRKLQTMPDQ